MKIDKDIPISGRNNYKGIGPPCKYPWVDMKVGDSIYVTITIGGIASTANSWRKRNKPDWVFSARKEGEGVRIWRIK